MTLVSDSPSDSELPEPVPSPEEIAEELAEVDAAADPAAPPVDREPDPVEASPLADERRYPSTIGGMCYLAVLAVGAVGLGVVWSGDWRLGIRLLAAGLCAAALLRLALPSRDAGMLAVRNRVVDCLLLGGTGAALFFLTATIPNQPG